MQKYQNVVVDNQGNVLYGATVTVLLSGSETKASIYSDNGATPKNNPFVTTELDGSFEFYALSGRYDITIAKTGYILSPITDVILFDPADSPLVFGGHLASPGNIYMKEGQSLICTTTGLPDGTQRSAINFKNDKSIDFKIGLDVKFTIDASGNLVLPGTVDGRDLSTDGTKLDAIESGATADQTGAEIKVLYEAELNTNAFTDAEQSKLAGIESGATADQTGAEIKVLYEAELNTNAFTDAEQTKLAGIEDGATADQSASEIKIAYESNTNTNAFTDTLLSKLNGIEAGATADQAWGEIGGTLANQTDLQNALNAKLADVSGDTTPSLGGNLDVSGNAIISIANGDIDITPNGTGKTSVTNLEAPLPTNNQTGTSYTLVIGDAGKHVTMNNASANTLTIPANTSVAFPVGTQVLITQLGAGQTTVAITTDTLNVAATFTLKLAEQYSQAVITKLTSTTWVICGDLGAA